MKKHTKIISILTAVVMMLSCVSFAPSAFAADMSQCAVISFDAVENNSYIDDTAAIINANRAQKGMSQLTLDAALTEQAKQRAKDMFVYYDSRDELLPSGDSVDSYFPTGIYTLMYRYYSLPSYDSLASAVGYDSTVSYTQSAASIGIGFCTVNNVTAMYIVFSYAQPAQAYQNFTDAAVKASVTTLTSNVKLYFGAEADDNYMRYNCTTKASFANGCAAGYVDISNDQLTYKSSKPSVAKYKDGHIYPKKNGQYSITVTLKSNTAVSDTYSDSFTGFNKPQITVSSLKSTKKKSFTVKWKKDIKDADGYEIQYSTSKKFAKKKTKTVTVKGRSKGSKAVSKLKSGKKYYVRVRAYANQGGGEKYYGAWSKTKSIKVK